MELSVAMSDEDMTMEFQLHLADLANGQRKLFAVRALHRLGRYHACIECKQDWPCSTRKALDS